MSDCTTPSSACRECVPGVSDSNIVRNRLDQIPWEHRQCTMIDNARGVRDYFFALSPMSRQFLVHPQLNSDTALFLVWDGLKCDFADTDIVPIPEWAAEAVAAYVKSKILRVIDKDAGMSREAWADYLRLRLALYREQLEAQAPDNKDEEYGDRGQFVIPPGAFADFGAQEYPFLSTITQLEGTDNTALAAVPTTSIPVVNPFAVEILIGFSQTWMLRAGTDANDPAGGILRPNDFATGTNEKVWYKLNV